MRYYALATDYDGTIAHDGIVNEATLEALRRLRDSGRRLLLVTGRRMEDLVATFPPIDIFEIIVAENGGLLHFPSSGQETPLAEPPSEQFVSILRARGVTPLAVGRAIVATWDSQKEAVLQTIQELGLELQIIFNKGALMVLPSGISKASGLKAALDRFGISPHNTVGIGDAENDHAFLRLCECSAAVSNAIPALKERCDIVTKGDHGAGVSELIERLLAGDLDELAGRLRRHEILLGNRPEGAEVKLAPYGVNVLVAGSSGGGKSTLTTGLMERLVENRYQFLTIDPEGDYEKFEGAIVLGDTHHGPDLGEVMSVLDKPDRNVIVNLLGVGVEDRPNFFSTLFPRLLELRVRTGRPHWLIVDEAHHLLPGTREMPALTLPPDFCGLMLITLGPDKLAAPVLPAVDTVIAVGERPAETIGIFCRHAGIPAPHLPATQLEKGEALQWSKRAPREPIRFQVAPSRSQRTRHRRKYSEGELTPDRSFFFRGSKGKLNLRAQNLMTFIQLMEGVDDQTWLFHLHRGEYSKWFRENIKSDDLADAAEPIEKARGISAEESRRRMKRIIEERYTQPA